MTILSADVRPAKITRIPNLTASTTRRAMIGGAGLAAIAAAVPAIASTAPPHRHCRDEWYALVAEYQALRAISDTATETLNDVEEAYYEERPATPVFTIEMEGDYGRFGKHVLPLTLTHDELDDHARGWKDPDQIAGFRQRLAEYRAADEAVLVRHGVNGARQAARAAAETEIAAYDRVVSFPAVDLAMLAEKLTVVAPAWSEDAPVWAALCADAKRVASSEARA